MDMINMIKLKKDLNKIYGDISDANFNDTYQIKEALYRILGVTHNLITELEKFLSQKE